ncbi:MAG: hypothetical protein A2381_03105 [Bdellovibrionales bacterium RIFOXYB1_FULL_37_110]|nr:MAG: hypothetical protein A2381_03105 [Bdellovibrionales bacterium RIFOXYB1_FULL_37_110]
MNFYRYVFNSPLINLDPNGESFEKIVCHIGASFYHGSAGLWYISVTAGSTGLGAGFSIGAAIAGRSRDEVVYIYNKEFDKNYCTGKGRKWASEVEKYWRDTTYYYYNKSKNHGQEFLMNLFGGGFDCH